MNREEALDVALGQIERQFGKGSVMRMSDQAQVSIAAISTGSLSLDLALGIGGLPRGRVVEIFGPESSGKTTLVYHVIAEAQRRGGICAFIDAEHAMDPSYARRIGVNIDDLLVSQPDTGEQALEIAELLVRSGALDVVAVDSVAALTPKAEIEGEMGDSHVGLQARLMSQALRKLAGTLNRTDTICLFTNQLREKIGVMFGSPETTPGGRALKFYSSVRLDIRRIETLKDGAEAFGNRVRVKVVKNKVAPPFKQAEFDIIYGSGISWEGSVLDVALERKIVQKSGSYFSFGDERLGQGRQNATAFLAREPRHRPGDPRPHPGRGAGRSRSSPPGCCRRRRARRARDGDGRSRTEVGRARGRPELDGVPVVTALRGVGAGPRRGRARRRRPGGSLPLEAAVRRRPRASGARARPPAAQDAPRASCAARSARGRRSAALAVPRPFRPRRWTQRLERRGRRAGQREQHARHARRARARRRRALRPRPRRGARRARARATC